MSLKTSSNSRLKLLTLLFVFLLYQQQSRAQYKYNFRNPSELSCTDVYCQAAGSSWLYQNVATGTDAIVNIDYVSPHATLDDIDNDNVSAGKPFAEAFLPMIRVDPMSTGYIDFTITFIKSGTWAGTPVPVLQDSVPATAVDIDGSSGLGNTLYEWDAINEGGGNIYYNGTTTQISVTNTGNNVTGKNITGVDYPGLDTTTRDIMFTVVNKKISSIKYEIGAVNNYNSSLVRTKGIYWKKFSYPTTVIVPLPTFLNAFDGQVENQVTRLHWSVSDNENLQSFVVEWSEDAIHFTQLGQLQAEQSPGTALYSFSTATVNNGFFRLKLLLKSKNIVYSQVLILKSRAESSALSAFPNPATSAVTLKVNAPDNGLAKLIIYDALGNIVLSRPFQLVQGVASYAIDLTAIRRAGNYQITVYLVNGQRLAQPLVIVR